MSLAGIKRDVASNSEQALKFRGCVQWGELSRGYRCAVLARRLYSIKEELEWKLTPASANSLFLCSRWTAGLKTSVHPPKIQILRLTKGTIWKGTKWDWIISKTVSMCPSPLRYASESSHLTVKQFGEITSEMAVYLVFPSKSDSPSEFGIQSWMCTPSILYHISGRLLLKTLSHNQSCESTCGFQRSMKCIFCKSLCRNTPNIGFCKVAKVRGISNETTIFPNLFQDFEIFILKCLEYVLF